MSSVPEDTLFNFKALRKDHSKFYAIYDAVSQKRIYFILFLAFFFFNVVFAHISLRSPVNIWYRLVHAPVYAEYGNYTADFQYSIGFLCPYAQFLKMEVKFVRFNQEFERNTDLAVTAEINYFKDYHIIRSENITSLDQVVKFKKGDNFSYPNTFYFSHNLDFHEVECNVHLSMDFGGIKRVFFGFYVFDPNMFNYFILMRIVFAFLCVYSLFGFLLTYTDNRNFPLHKETVVCLILSICTCSPFDYLVNTLYSRIFTAISQGLFVNYFLYYTLKFILNMLNDETKPNATKMSENKDLMMKIKICLIIKGTVDLINNVYLVDFFEQITRYHDAIAPIEVVLIIFNLFFLFYMGILSKRFIVQVTIDFQDKKFVIGTFLLTASYFVFITCVTYGVRRMLRHTSIPFLRLYAPFMLILFIITYIHNTKCCGEPTNLEK
ncbi:hypothetical protein TRFO_40352 [Tritrichomonas foetus]|uniref:Uncharacterized protein n=1 Tax=Tritrichomonas foetus TaxID=1144522 RepID=A0A1J4J7C1_9EUKA|nr:hypothetical protein TRFO_40352 [Tritrichomonas foetus]|eukprot:OHS93357.1 hypothetical protein TRFO_40352 [Tritrichomonas foetus]